MQRVYCNLSIGKWVGTDLLGGEVNAVIERVYNSYSNILPIRCEMYYKRFINHHINDGNHDSNIDRLISNILVNQHANGLIMLTIHSTYNMLIGRTVRLLGLYDIDKLDVSYETGSVNYRVNHDIVDDWRDITNNSGDGIILNPFVMGELIPSANNYLLNNSQYDEAYAMKTTAITAEFDMLINSANHPIMTYTGMLARHHLKVV